VICIAQIQEQHVAMCAFMEHYAHVGRTEDMRVMGWFDQETNELKCVIAMNGFMGNTCQVHIAMADNFHFAPRVFISAAADLLFNHLKRERIIGFVNSHNKKAMRFDRHMGYEEILRLPKAHDDGGDIVIFSMTREQCKYLPKAEVAHENKYAS